MAFDIGELVGKMRLDSSQFDEGIKKGKSSLVGLKATFEDTSKSGGVLRDSNGKLRDEFGKFVSEGGQTSGFVKKLGDQFTWVKSTADKLHNAMQGVTQGFGQFAGMQIMNGLSSAVGFAKDAVFGFNAELQNSGIAFTTMLGSGQKAQVFLDQLKAFAKSTPFSFGDLVTNAQNMMGMGIAAKDVIPDLTALGDSVASVGGTAEQVKQVTLAFDQMNAKGTVDLGNMNQLMEGGVPNALKIMASAYHVTTGEMISMISAGKVQSSDALPALINGLEKGTASTAALGGMMDKQSQTFTGALSNIQDGLQQAIAGAFKPFFDVASTGAQALGTFFSSNKFAAFGADAQSGMTKAFAAIKGFNFSPIISAFHSIVDVVKNDIIPIGQDIAKVFGPPLIAAFTGVYGAIGPVTGALKPVGDALKTIFDFMGSHATTFQALAVGILAVAAAQKIWTIATEAWTAVTKAAAAAQVLLDAAMDANPIGLIVLAIIGLVAAFAYLWTHSAAFRDFFIVTWALIWNFLKGVGAWFAGPFTDFFVSGWHILQAIGAWFAGPFANFFVSAWHVIADSAMWLWHNILDPVWQAISAATAFVLNIVTSFANLWAFLWRNTIGAALLWLWHDVWVPAVNGITAAAMWLYTNVLVPIGHGIAVVFSAIGTAAVWLWQNVFVPVGHGIAIAAQAIGVAAMWLWHNAIEPAFHGIASVASWLWGFISANFNFIMGIVHKVGDAFKSVFSAIGGYISSAFSGAVGIIRGAMNGIISVINSAISGINTVIHAANSIPGVSFPSVPSIPHLASGGKVLPRTGGTPVIMGDGGQVEYGVPRSDMEAIIGQAVQAGGQVGGGVLTVIFRGDGIMAGIRKQVRIQGGSAQTVLVGQ